MIFAPWAGIWVGWYCAKHLKTMGWKGKVSRAKHEMILPDMAAATVGTSCLYAALLRLATGPGLGQGLALCPLPHWGWDQSWVWFPAFLCGCGCWSAGWGLLQIGPQQSCPPCPRCATAKWTLKCRSPFPTSFRFLVQLLADKCSSHKSPCYN